MNPDDPWRRLAAELGLDPSPEPEPPDADPRRGRPAEDVIGGNEAPPEAIEPEVPVAEAGSPAPTGRGRRRRSAAPREESEPAAEAPAPALDPTAEAEPLPASGRGRRGRSAQPAEAVRADLPESDAVAETEPAAGSEAASEVCFQEGKSSGQETEAEEEPRRRRRRSRRKKSEKRPSAEAAESEGVVSAGAGAESEPATEDADDGPEEIVSDWNVPSWDELIASLHRPER
jgi:hypothetical protein